MCFCNCILLNEDTKIETETSPWQQVKMESDYKSLIAKTFEENTLKTIAESSI